MRILVYGAGVLGCELTHVLLQNKKNVVTLLARGEWKEMIDQKGLVIRHWAQRRTTTERVKTIDVLAPDKFTHRSFSPSCLRFKWVLCGPAPSF